MAQDSNKQIANDDKSNKTNKQDETKELKRESFFKKKRGLIIFSVMIIALISFFLVRYAGKVSLLYLTVDEVLDRLESVEKNTNKEKKQVNLVGKMFRIRGNLRPHTTKRYKGRTDYKFDIMSKITNRFIPVHYSGILPDNFQDHAELVLEGKLEKRRLFRAYSILAKCSSKYKEHKIIYGKKKLQAKNQKKDKLKKGLSSKTKLTLKTIPKAVTKSKLTNNRSAN